MCHVLHECECEKVGEATRVFGEYRDYDVGLCVGRGVPVLDFVFCGEGVSGDWCCARGNIGYGDGWRYSPLILKLGVDERYLFCS